MCYLAKPGLETTEKLSLMTNFMLQFVQEPFDAHLCGEQILC